METALVIGINELRQSHGNEVLVVVRRGAIEKPDPRLANPQHLLDKSTIHAGSVDDHLSIYNISAKMVNYVIERIKQAQ